MGAWGHGQFENDTALDELDRQFNPLAFSLYEHILRATFDPDAHFARAVALAEIVSSIGLRCPQSLLSREEAERWRDRMISIIERKKLDWSVESRQAAMSTFDLLVSIGSFDEGIEEEVFRIRYEAWCESISRDPVPLRPNTRAEQGSDGKPDTVAS
jgi:hypothetical protein